jgi:hypothetical protein
VLVMIGWVLLRWAVHGVRDNVMNWALALERVGRIARWRGETGVFSMVSGKVTLFFTEGSVRQECR